MFREPKLKTGGRAIFNDGGSTMPEEMSGKPVLLERKWRRREIRKELSPDLHCTDVYDIIFDDGTTYTAFDSELTPISAV